MGSFSVETAPHNNDRLSVTGELQSGPLFVVGMWRSGTSLLYALLNNHPRVALMYEGDLPLFRSLFISGIRDKNWPEKWDFWSSALARHQIAAEDIPGNVRDVRTATEAVYKKYARQRGATIWGDKSPSYYQSLVYLAETFPNSRFIIIWRDPAAICRSILEAGKHSRWFRKRGMFHQGVLGSERLKEQCDELVSRGVRVHQLHYEDIVRDPASEMKRVCDFLEIPYDPAMISLKDADHSAIPEGGQHALVKGGQIVSSPDRERSLPPRTEQKIREYAAFWRKKYGTWPAYSSLSAKDADPPTVADRIADRFRCEFWRLRDEAVRFIYSLAPLRLLQGYRAYKQCRRENR
jgi:hypothetical protein